MDPTYEELQGFYKTFHRKLAAVLNDVERRAAEFYFYEGRGSLRICPPSSHEITVYWNQEAKRLMRSKNRDNRPNFSDEHKAWATARAGYQRMPISLALRFSVWKAGKELGIDPRISLAFERIPNGKLKSLSIKGILTTAQFAVASDSSLSSLPRFGKKTVNSLRQKVRPARKKDKLAVIQPSLAL